MAGTSQPYGIIAEFDTPAAVMHAAEKVRDAGFRRWDVYTPYPVHGMDKAMGMKNSKVGWFSFLGGVTGYTSGMLMILCDPGRRQADVQPIWSFPPFIRTYHSARCIWSYPGDVILKSAPPFASPLTEAQTLCPRVSRPLFHCGRDR
jgi:hypothetical protein